MMSPIESQSGLSVVRSIWAAAQGPQHLCFRNKERSAPLHRLVHSKSRHPAEVRSTYQAQRKSPTQFMVSSEPTLAARRRLWRTMGLTMLHCRAKLAVRFFAIDVAPMEEMAGKATTAGATYQPRIQAGRQWLTMWHSWLRVLDQSLPMLQGPQQYQVRPEVRGRESGPRST